MQTMSMNRRRLLGGALALGVAGAMRFSPNIAFAQDEAAAPAVGSANWTKFNLNAASDEQLLSIPGVGDKMLDEFREYAPFTSIAQFRQEIGKYVDEETVAAYERYLFVPVDPASADEATLAQLPGVSADLAAELAGGGPYADGAALIAALDGKISAEQLAALPAFIAGTAADVATWSKFNLNAASDEQLLSIPGMGEKMLDEFHEYAPYASIVQFREEIGKYVDEETVAAYEQYVFVPVDPAGADEATIAQLPGMDADKAAELAGGEPFTDAAAFLAALAGMVSADQAALAVQYLVTA